jgi:3-hydroxybutyrate dehydrogenase
MSNCRRAAREGISQANARTKLRADKQPSLEFATPEQIGGLAVFLCSPSAEQIRGTTLSIDGGWTAQ